MDEERINTNRKSNISHVARIEKVPIVIMSAAIRGSLLPVKGSCKPGCNASVAGAVARGNRVCARIGARVRHIVRRTPSRFGDVQRVAR
jgi:hypothetical protein